MELYIGTYAKYNNGDISGAWLKTSDYRSYDDFIEAVKAVHSDEDDPEYMVQDYDGTPNLAKHFGECLIRESEFEALSELDADEWEAFDAYICLVGPQTIDSDTIESFRNEFRGVYKSELEFTEEWVDGSGMLDGVPESFKAYFDYEAYSRDIFINDFSHIDGFVFSR